MYANKGKQTENNRSTGKRLEAENLILEADCPERERLLGSRTIDLDRRNAHEGMVVSVPFWETGREKR